MNAPIWLREWLSLQNIAALLVVYLVTLVFYRLTLHPLARFPGPKFAAVTRWYEAYYDIVRNGHYTFKIAEMHKKYGKLNIARWQAFSVLPGIPVDLCPSRPFT